MKLNIKLRRVLPQIGIAGVLLMMLIGLGIWQLQRLGWKNALLAQIAQGEAQPAVPLAATPLPFTRVRVTGHFRNDESALYGAEVRDTDHGPEMGAQLLTVMDRADGPPILVDRGWIPTIRSAVPIVGGAVTIDGYIRQPEQPGWLSATDQVSRLRFFTLDVGKIAAIFRVPDLSPFVLVAMGPLASGSFPQPAQHLPQPVNNHFSYAITWFGLAATLVVITGAWVRQAWQA